MVRNLESVFADKFREPNTTSLSPYRIGAYLGLSPCELAQRAHVADSVVVNFPKTPQLQSYLRDLIRVLMVAEELTADPKRASILIQHEELPAFGFKTADTLIQEGRVDDVVAYLESLASGAAG